MKIPEHMQAVIEQWVERGTPHPNDMGAFIRAVLANDFVEAVACADDDNRDALISWALYLHNEVPALAHGNLERLLAWHERGGLSGKVAA